MNKKLSVIILTRNEEKNIRECMKSVSFADEIVVIDDNSTDKTRDIAEKMGAVVYKRKLDDFATQRNFGISKATGKWILFIDADERVPTELHKEIMSAIGNHSNEYYKIPRKNKLFGKYLQYTDWYPDYQHRLFKSGEALWDRRVHEQLKTKSEPISLSEPLLHDNYDTIDQFITKNYGSYADYEADVLISSGYVFYWPDLLVKPAGEFMRRYFATEGYKDGIHGLVASILVSISTFIVYAKVWEREGFKEIETPLGTVRGHLMQIDSDMRYWIRRSVLSKEKNLLVKLMRKVID